MCWLASDGLCLSSRLHGEISPPSSRPSLMSSGLDNKLYSLTNDGENSARRELLWLGATPSPLPASWLLSSSPHVVTKIISFSYENSDSITSSSLKSRCVYFKYALQGPPRRSSNSRSNPCFRTGANKWESGLAFPWKIKNRTGTRVLIHGSFRPALVLFRAPSG